MKLFEEDDSLAYGGRLGPEDLEEIGVEKIEEALDESPIDYDLGVDNRTETDTSLTSNPKLDRDDEQIVEEYLRNQIISQDTGFDIPETISEVAVNYVAQGTESDPRYEVLFN